MTQRIHDSNCVAGLEILQDAGHVTWVIWVEGYNKLLAPVILGYDSGTDEVLGLDDLS